MGMGYYYLLCLKMGGKCTKFLSESQQKLHLISRKVMNFVTRRCDFRISKSQSILLYRDDRP